MNNQDEQYLIKLIQEGKKNSEIATTIFKSVPTVKQMVSQLLKKHKCKNRVQLAMKDINVP